MDLPIKTKLGRYEIRSLIGEGGMGQVYRAHDTELGRDVAVKVLPASFAADPDRISRFRTEAQALAKLTHPNIVSVLDIGSEDQTIFIVTELLEGEELRHRLNTGSLAQRQAIGYAAQIAQGLAAAYERGIIHRDLKPENIFVTKDERVKILDFGLAKLAPTRAADVETEAATLIANTDPGAIMGTAGYMSPEQVRGDSVDHRSDIFSFGAMLYEMLTGKRAFRGDSAVETMHAILKQDPPDPIDLSPGLDPALDRLVRRCLEKSPARRFQCASDLAFALETLPRIPLASGDRQHPRTAERRTRRQAAAVGLLIALVALTIVAYFMGQRAGRISVPRYQRLTFNRGTIWRARFAPDGQTVVYSARWNGGPLDVFSVRSGKNESRSLNLEGADLAAVSSTSEMAVLRKPEYLGQFISHGTLARVGIDGGASRDLVENVQEADWSRDGSRFAVVRWTNGHNTLEYPAGKPLYETSGYISHPRISPDGNQVAFMDHQVQWDNRGWVVLVDAAGNKKTLSGEWAGEEGLAWSPDGSEVWFAANRAGEPNALYAVTLAGKERLVARTPISLILYDISRDGRVLISTYSDVADIVGQAPGEARERDLSCLDHGGVSDLSQDGKEFLFTYDGEGAGANYAVYLRKTDGSPAVLLGEGFAQRLSPDGRWALTVLYTPPQLILLPTGAGETRTLERGPIEQYTGGACWFPDGKRVVFQAREPGRDWRCYVQSVEGGAPQPVTPEGTTRTWQGIFVSPDGQSLIASDAQNRPSFYPVEGGAARPIPYLEKEDEIVGWATEGRSLYVARTGEMPIRVYRFDPSSGRRDPVKEIMPPDLTGIFWPNYILMTPDGRGYVYVVRRLLSDLYIVHDLK